jgi:hypothetical protein
MTDRRKLQELENELHELVSEAAHRTLMSEADIYLELEDCGSIRITPPQVSPDVWDPEGKLRRIYAQIGALKKQIDSEKQPPA